MENEYGYDPERDGACYIGYVYPETGRVKLVDYDVGAHVYVSVRFRDGVPVRDDGRKVCQWNPHDAVRFNDMFRLAGGVYLLPIPASRFANIPNAAAAALNWHDEWRKIAIDVSRFCVERYGLAAGAPSSDQDRVDRMNKLAQAINSGVDPVINLDCRLQARCDLSMAAHDALIDADFIW